ncbi:MAG: hypothetical protein ACR2QK_22760 [Acidimicrobiales bacterium]
MTGWPLLLVVMALLLAACSTSDEATNGEASAAAADDGTPAVDGAAPQAPTVVVDQTTTEASSPSTTVAADPTTTSTQPPAPLPDVFVTLEPGTTLPDERRCADHVLTGPDQEVRPENAEANATVVNVAVEVDGAGDWWNGINADRVTGNFTGTTDQVLRWASCKWGFDEEITRARAVAESSWRVSTAGDVTDDPDSCRLLEMQPPCAQSYGLLQVKGTVHEGTHPASVESAAFGVDYAMAWLRACYEGHFTWFESPSYDAGDEWGCVGAWFSGNWWDQPANDYVGTVRFHLAEQTWTSYGP